MNTQFKKAYQSTYLSLRITPCDINYMVLGCFRFPILYSEYLWDVCIPVVVLWIYKQQNSFCYYLNWPDCSPKTTHPLLELAPDCVLQKCCPVCNPCYTLLQEMFWPYGRFTGLTIDTVNLSNVYTTVYLWTCYYCSPCSFGNNHVMFKGSLQHVLLFTWHTGHPTEGIYFQDVGFTYIETQTSVTCFNTMETTRVSPMYVSKLKRVCVADGLLIS